MTNSTEVFPIVGCPAVRHPDVADYDRRWFLVDEACQWLPLTRSGPLAEVSIEVRHGSLVLRAPGMLRLDIPMDVIEDDESVWRVAQVSHQSVRAVDEGELAAAWFGNVLNRPCRLFKLHPDESTPSFA